MRDDEYMSNDILSTLSTQLADVADRAGASVVQVRGRRRPASGVVYGADVIVTTAGALGREDALHIRRADGVTLDARLTGWDPATGLAVLRVPGLDLPALAAATTPARVGHLALALARSWSNSLTASNGIIAVIGGPLPTGRRRAIDEVIRTTAPMHEGFSGGALIDMTGGLAGIATAARIRGLGVVIPTAIAWKTAALLLEHGTTKRPFLGIAAQPATLPDGQEPSGPKRALLVVGVTPGSPAAQAGVLLGDVIVALDGRPLHAPEDLLEALATRRAGQAVSLRLLRGGVPADIPVMVGEREG